MTKDELEKDVITYLRQQLGLNGGGMVSCDLKKLLLGFAEPRENRIADLEEIIANLKEQVQSQVEATIELDKENAELRKVAEFQQSSNMSRHFENKKLKEGLAVGSILNKGLNSLNKTLEEERDKYRNMVFDKDEQLTKAKEILNSLYFIIQSRIDYENNTGIADEMWRAEQFLKEI